MKKLEILFFLHNFSKFENKDKEIFFFNNLNKNHPNFVNKERIEKIKRSGYIEINTINKKKYITYEGFKNKYNESINSKSVEPLIYKAVNFSEESEKEKNKKKNDKLRKESVLIIDKIKIYLEKLFDFSFDSEQKLIIKSNFDQILHFPWEELGKDIERTVIRENLLIENSNDNILILISRAYDSGDDIYNGIIEEIKNLLFVIEESFLRPKASFDKEIFKISLIIIQRHLTKNYLKNLNNSMFKIIHLIAHGAEDGCISFEKEDNFRGIDFCSVDDFLSFF